MLQESVTFPGTTKAEWEAILLKELKGAPLETLLKKDEIEELEFWSFQHRSDQKTEFSDPGLSPFTRGGKQNSNEWLIGKAFYWRSETDAVALNKDILNQLMKGTTSILIVAETNKELSFQTVLKEVALEYIYTSFQAKTVEQALAFIHFLGEQEGAVQIEGGEELHSNSSNCKTAIIDGYAVQQAGATSWQEIAVTLGEGHDYIVQQLEKGVDIDTITANMQVVLGIGTKYVTEIAKFRAFRTCWANMIAAYQPVSEKSNYVRVSAKTGFTHISLKDPYTNLLRQTTQAMSAVIGGVDELIVQPYDAYSTEQNPEFTQRMATNISLLLQEESYLNVVVDAAGGAYAFDMLTNEIASKAWALFQELEKGGGISDETTRTKLANQIAEKAALRVARIAEKKDKLIGINIFPNPTQEKAEWKSLPKAWNNLPTLNLEQTL